MPCAAHCCRTVFFRPLLHEVVQAADIDLAAGLRMRRLQPGCSLGPLQHVLLHQQQAESHSAAKHLFMLLL